MVESSRSGGATRAPSITGVSLSRSSSSLSSSSLPPALLVAQASKRPPPRVIPYHKHQEGKKRLAEVLKQQNQRTSVGSLDQGAVLKMLASPESLQPPDDLAEKASLDSRGSTEASISISSGEVATGTLIDLADVPRHTAVVETEEGRTRERTEEEKEGNRERSNTGSDSMVSTASSSSEELTISTVNQRTGWVNFEEDDSFKPPLPPPRSELDNISGGGEVLVNPLVETTSEEVVDFNPFATTDSGPAATGRVSPFEDFGAQVAQTLFNQSRNRSSLDSYTADLMATASRDIYMALNSTSHPPTIPERRESGVSLPEPLVPTSSSGSLSSLEQGSCPQTVPSINPFAPPPPLSSATNGFPPSHPLVHREWVRPKGPPPPKPQPYSGKPVSVLCTAARTDDPFGNLLEGLSMEAYASSPSSSSLSSVNKCSSPGGQLPPSASQHTSVESPLV
jgi:hypothetical protein